MADQYEAHVPPELADLLPEFLRNRRSQLLGLRRAVKEQDFQRVREYSNSMIGVGRPYGFPEISSLGKRIDNCARDGDGSSVTYLVELYAHYLENVRVHMPDGADLAEAAQ
jgi:hypothetical protein